jgi:hypothetical protein
MQGHIVRYVVRCCSLALLPWLVACNGASVVATPQPIELPGETNPDHNANRRAWIERMHLAAPGDNWREIDANNLAAALEKRMSARAAARSSGIYADADVRTVALGGGASGEWRERGSGNQAGRVVGGDYDPATQRVMTYAHGGQIWSANRGALDWQSLNDSVQFVPNGAAGSFLRLGGEPDRLLVASDRPNGLYLSDDRGETWTAASGFPASNTWYAQGLERRGGGAEIYMLRNHFDSGLGVWRPKLFASSDRGSTFSDRGFIGTRDQAALFAPTYQSSEVYLLDGLTLFRIAPGTHALQTVSTIAGGFGLENRRVLLTGGVTPGGDTFLYAIYAASGGPESNTSRVFRSLDGGLSWTPRTNAPVNAFGFNSAASSTQNPDVVFLGSVNTYRSTDGATTWQLVNDWADYYGSPATKLHADIPAIDVFRDPGGFERVLVSTDGGLFESTDNLLTVQNLSLDGLNVSQYYGSYTRRSPPYDLHIGAQDQGFQRALAPGEGGLLDLTQTISGDYGHLVSGDGGNSLWSNYPGFSMLDLTPGALNQGGLRLWQFGSANFNGWLFLAPMVPDPADPMAVYLAGGRLGAGTGNHIIRVRWNGAAFAVTSGSHDFGAGITALAISPQNANLRFAMTSARNFFRSTDGGATWINTASSLPANHYFWGQRILPHPAIASRVYVAGSGYSNPGVFVSDDNGASFTPFSTGLPNTLVYDIAMSADGSHLFAATEVGAFRYDTAAAAWTDITGLGGPAQTFWHVDFVDALNTARFSTYGRGIWDFVLNDGDTIFAHGFETMTP